MDSKMLDYCNERVAKLNTDIITSVATTQLNKVEMYIDWVWKCASKGFPEGLKYKGGRRCTPRETFTELTKTGSPNRIYDMARSDVYLMRYDFEYKGVKLKPKHIFLPFINDGGLMFIRDTQYSVTPVISGRVFNIEQNNIYLPSTRLRMGFWQINISCLVNDMEINPYAVGSYLFSIYPETDRSPLKPLLIHYLLAKYGLAKTLKFYKLTAKVGGKELDELDKSKWFVFKSKLIHTAAFYEGLAPEIRIAVSCETYYTLASNIIASIFYIFDNAAEATAELDELNNPNLWLRLLDFFIYKERCGETKLKERMTKHLESMESTIDSITIDTFRRAGVDSSTIFELFRHLTLNFQDMCVHYDYGTMYDLQLCTVEPLTFGVRKDIFNTMYILQKTPDIYLEEAKINSIISKNIKRDRILDWKGHGELEPVSVASSCMVFGPSADLITHRKATGVSGDGMVDLNDRGLLMHQSLLEIASIHACTGKDFTGRSIANPYQEFSNGYVTSQASDTKSQLDRLGAQLKRGKHLNEVNLC
jgi:hypothetical protein